MSANSIALIDTALDASGGVDRCRDHSFLSAHLSQGGDLWAMKGQGGVLGRVKVLTNLGVLDRAKQLAVVKRLTETVADAAARAEAAKLAGDGSG